MANQRKGLPAGWTWRDGRPRLKFSPALRKAGWRDHDLKDADGRFLGRGASIDQAQAVADAVAAWRAGDQVPARFAGVAPAGSAAAAHAKPLSRVSIAALIEAYTGTRTAKAAPEFAGLKASTQRDYKGKLKRLVDVLAGYVELPREPTKDAPYQARVQAVRAMSIFTLEPEIQEDGTVLSDLLYDAYHALLEEVGEHQAAGVLAAASAWLSWVHERKNRKVQNWAKDVKRRTPQGRIRPLTWQEIFALVKAADELGLPSIGDSVILGVDLSWSQTDRLQLPWNRLKDGVAYTGAEGRKKTGRVGETKLLDGLGLARLPEIVARHEKMDAHPTHVLWCELTGAQWKADHYRHKFAEVRAHAAKTCPSVADATDADLRDTAVTVCRAAGLTIEQTCSRTLQSRKRVLDLWDRHYGDITAEDIAEAAKRLNAYLKERKVAL